MLQYKATKNSSFWTSLSIACIGFCIGKGGSAAVAATEAASPTQLQNELNAAKQLWGTFNTQQYFFELQVPYSPNPQAIAESPTTFGIQVSHDIVTDISSMDLFEIPETLQDTAPSIGGIFGLIQNTIDQNNQSPLASTIDVTYNTEFGYPEQFSIIHRTSSTSTTTTSKIPSTTTNNKQSTVVPIVDTTNGSNLVGSITSFTPTSLRSDQLLASKAIWEGFGYNSYDMIYQRHQFIPAPFSSKLLVQVRNGVPTKVMTVADDGVTIRDDVTDEFTSISYEIPTVLGLFAELESILSNDQPQAVVIEYNWMYQFPSFASIDIHKEIQDEEFAFEIHQLTPIVNHQEELDEALAKWNVCFPPSTSETIAAGSKYSFGLERGCSECVPGDDFAPNTWVKVEDGQVVSVSDEYGNVITSLAVLNDTPSIEEIFLMVQEAIDVGAFSIVVLYSDDCGLPLHVSIDYHETIADEEISLSLTSFLPVSWLESENDMNQALWTSMGYPTAHYKFSYYRYCFHCPEKPVVVEVKDGMVVSVDGEAISLNGSSTPSTSSSLTMDIPTIDDVFEIIRSALDEQHAFSVSVVYDASHGYPVNVNIDYISMVLDEELTAQIGDFVVLDGDNNGSGGSLIVNSDPSMNDQTDSLDGGSVSVVPTETGNIDGDEDSSSASGNNLWPYVSMLFGMLIGAVAVLV